MGLFSGKTEPQSTLPPNKALRTACWHARDAFFACLDANAIDNSLDPSQRDRVQAKCGPQLTALETDCVAVWVKYFQEKRAVDLVRKRALAQLQQDGAQELPFRLSGRK